MPKNETPPHILIVDDLPQNIQLISNVLINKGYKVSFATSGIKALKIVDKSDYDLIILDIAMPVMDGFETMKHLAKGVKSREIPVLFLTAHNTSEEVVKAFQLGASDFVSKPFNLAELAIRVRNLVELKRSREELRRQNAEMLDLLAVRDKFFDIVAHDLKNPVNNLTGFAKLMQRAKKEGRLEKVAELSDHFEVSAEHIAKIVQDLLVWARLQVGRMLCQPAANNMVSNVSYALNAINDDLLRKDIKLDLSMPAQAMVWFDPSMLSEVIRSLLSNAVKYSRPGGKVSVRVSEHAESTSLYLEDQGVGISADRLADLFVLGKHRSTQGTQNELGSGLGLIIAKRMAELNQAELRFFSIDKEGTKVELICKKAAPSDGLD